MKGVEGAVLALQQAAGGPPGELICDLADVFKTRVGHGGERTHEVAVVRLERPGDAGMLIFLRVS